MGVGGGVNVGAGVVVGTSTVGVIASVEEFFVAVRASATWVLT